MPKGLWDDLANEYHIVLTMQKPRALFFGFLDNRFNGSKASITLYTTTIVLSIHDCELSNGRKRGKWDDDYKVAWNISGSQSSDGSRPLRAYSKGLHMHIRRLSRFKWNELLWQMLE